jgi:tRNA-splicing ligase RtcB
MPDAHVGKGATIGTVIATDAAIVPAAVGVDIGCGMIAARTELSASDLPDDLSPLHGEIAARVPAGMGRGHEFEQAGAAWIGAHAHQPGLLSDRKGSRAAGQFGTLGSGNHFVEVCLDEQDRVWIVLHSGSRGIGKLLADRHIDAAKGLMRRYFIELEDPDLAYLVEGTPEFDEYIADMLWAQDYAAANRARMLELVVAALAQFLGHPVAFLETRNCHHNYTEREQVHGRALWITRKGAIRARVGDFGVIPGSMGTSSFIVEGLGNVASFCSSSHGAGRRLSRSAARRELTVADLGARMQGKAWNEGQADDLVDEHPDAYKDIASVMDAQSDLVRIHHELRQVLNYKGA